MKRFYITSNIPRPKQSPRVQEKKPERGKAFPRRIHHVVEYRRNGPPISHGPALEYIYPPDPAIPEWVQKAERMEQMELLP